MIEVKNIWKSYGESPVLEDVNVQIPEGRITAFIGPNGAGKSTLLGIITRVVKQDQGDVFIDGEDAKNVKSEDIAKKLSVLRQQNHLQVRLTVEDLVSFGRYPYSKGRLKKDDYLHIAEAIEYMGLTHMKDKFLDTLSGGERQRAFIAMVIAQDTDYIFLDEPLNNLDMKHSVEIMQMLQKLCAEKKKTVVIVIHDINFASCYADNILALKNNQVFINDEAASVITPEVLKNVFDMDFKVCDIEGNKICVFYT